MAEAVARGSGLCAALPQPRRRHPGRRVSADASLRCRRLRHDAIADGVPRIAARTRALIVEGFTSSRLGEALATVGMKVTNWRMGDGRERNLTNSYSRRILTRLAVAQDLVVFLPPARIERGADVSGCMRWLRILQLSASPEVKNAPFQGTATMCRRVAPCSVAARFLDSAGKKWPYGCVIRFHCGRRPVQTCRFGGWALWAGQRAPNCRGPGLGHGRATETPRCKMYETSARRVIWPNICVG